MKKIKKILSLALALCMTCGVMATAACKKETSSSSSSAPTAEEAEFTLTVTDEESGAGLKGVEFVMYNYYTDDLTAEFVTDDNGKASATVEYGYYYVEIDEETLPEGYHSRKEEWNVTIEEDGENSLAIELYYFEIAAPDGTENNPYPFFDVDVSLELATLNIPASGSAYYHVRNQEGAKLYVGSENVEVNYGGTTYVYDEALGAVVVPLATTDTYNTVKFEVVNKTAAAVTAEAWLVTNAGTQGNPLVLVVLGEVTANVEGDTALYYKWTAAEAGNLTVSGVDTESEIVKWKKEGGTSFEEASSMTVAAGDVILIEAAKLNGTQGTSYSVTFTLIFVAA